MNYFYSAAILRCRKQHNESTIMGALWASRRQSDPRKERTTEAIIHKHSRNIIKKTMADDMLYCRLLMVKASQTTD